MTARDQDAIDHELRILFQKISRRIRVNRADEAISDAQLSILFRLEEHGPLTPGRLAEHERVTPPSVNRTLNALEAEGRIRRVPRADDGRKVDVELTDAGRAVIAETRRLRSRWFTLRLEDLPQDERRALEAVIPTLRRLADS
ncbi:MarR family winged helix-turn-helix transcriptional regulator [Homoserinibacter sp. YIM 151385]|uniref:MarR family winged helix-turn-helix transcriptional regulator n=1 Tax=Homoserinibacter sp. YIM 151385 TaxID=2985506 RepID=UPI0022F07962|nr:MarR family transcriptional regulator [Homoserinibacter sp. YIM 151385]WBU37127.1 MarR family transcriptional regulator [Homoserinibacter sp. YIM 151385]